jgi:glycine C-acetyltransferase
MIITEGVFSVDGEVSPLPEIVRVAEEHEAVLMIDDAHGFGVLGERGGGTLEHFGLQGRADLVMGSFDKALGGMGGFLAGRHDVIQYLRMTSRPYLSSSAMPAVMAGAMIEAIDLCIRGRELRARLIDTAAQLRAELAALGFRILGGGQLPVVPVLIGQEEAAIAFSERLLEHGVYLPCYRFPVIARGTARVRATTTVLHQREHLARVVEAFQKADADLGLLREQNAAA